MVDMYGNFGTAKKKNELAEENMTMNRVAMMFNRLSEAVDNDDVRNDPGFGASAALFLRGAMGKESMKHIADDPTAAELAFLLVVSLDSNTSDVRESMISDYQDAKAFVADMANKGKMARLESLDDFEEFMGGEFDE